MGTRAIVCLVAALALTAAHAQIVANGHFDDGGYTYADHWRPLPGGGFRMLRKAEPRDGHSLYLQLREEGDGGVAQTVYLPAGRMLSLRMLATCWADGDDCALATLTRLSDGVVLAEVTVKGIERGELSANFDAGAGGPAELLVRLVGGRGARAAVEHVEIGPPVSVAREVAGPVFSGADLVLRPGDGLRVDADFTPRLLPAAAEMLQEALEDATGHPTERVARPVVVSVPQPETADWPARESYHLSVCNTGITIDAPAEQGAFWAMMTLIDLIRPEPSGGARILAVDVHDQPALPWRIGVDQRLIVAGDVVNAARRLARLKLNMGLVFSTQLTSEIAATLRSHAVEPVALVTVDPDAGAASAALLNASEAPQARYLLLSIPVTAVPEWTTEPLTTALAVARSDAAEVVVSLEPGSGRPGVSLEEMLEITRQAIPSWPKEVAFALPSIHARDLVEPLEQRGARWVTVLHRTPGDRTEIGGRGCVGAIMFGDHAEDAANLAWRGLPQGTRWR